MALENQQQQPEATSKSYEVSVPNEIVVEIFLRLPVESLLRCKSVCKLWLSLISDPYFVKSHYTLSLANYTLSLASNNRYAHHRIVYAGHFSPSNKQVVNEESVNTSDIDHLLKQHTSFSITGSCNGLLFIEIGEDNLFICNPATRIWNRLPCCGFKVSGVEKYVLYSFGYDESTDDYKVVAIRCWLLEGSADNKVKIYSFKTGKWKKFGVFPHGTPVSESGKFVNGALHWAATSTGYWTSSGDWKIISFDLSKETYGEVLKPKFEDEGSISYSTVGVLGEWLCVVCTYLGKRSDIWVMKDYGVKDSWTRLLSGSFLANHTRSRQMPLFISSNGKILLQLGVKLVVYDSKNGSFSKIQNIDEFHEACTFVESLVSPYASTPPIRP